MHAYIHTYMHTCIHTWTDQDSSQNSDDWETDTASTLLSAYSDENDQDSNRKTHGDSNAGRSQRGKRRRRRRLDSGLRIAAPGELDGMDGGRDPVSMHSCTYTYQHIFEMCEIIIFSARRSVKHPSFSLCLVLLYFAHRR